MGWLIGVVLWIWLAYLCVSVWRLASSDERARRLDKIETQRFYEKMGWRRRD